MTKYVLQYMSRSGKWVDFVSCTTLDAALREYHQHRHSARRVIERRTFERVVK